MITSIKQELTNFKESYVEPAIEAFLGYAKIALNLIQSLGKAAKTKLASERVDENTPSYSSRLRDVMTNILTNTPEGKSFIRAQAKPFTGNNPSPNKAQVEAIRIDTTPQPKTAEETEESLLSAEFVNELEEFEVFVLAQKDMDESTWDILPVNPDDPLNFYDSYGDDEEPLPLPQALPPVQPDTL